MGYVDAHHDRLLLDPYGQDELIALNEGYPIEFSDWEEDISDPFAVTEEPYFVAINSSPPEWAQTSVEYDTYTFLTLTCEVIFK